MTALSRLKTMIAQYRLERDMTQGELAELVGVRRETISRLEKGQYNPSLKLAMDIAEIFQVSVYDLFAFTADD